MEVGNKICPPQELLSLARARRSIRGFDRDRPISDEQVEFILETARWAPSAGNGQPWEFVVVRDPQTREKLLEFYDKQQEEKKAIELAIRPNTPGSRLTGPRFVTAPCLIIILGDPRVERSYPVRTRMDKAYKHFVTGLASATLLIHLAARSLGLGSYYVSDVASPYMAALTKALLNIPDELVIYDMVALGYPVKWAEPTPRRSLDSIVHYETYDRSRLRSEEEFNSFVLTQTRTGAFGKAAKRQLLNEELA